MKQGCMGSILWVNLTKGSFKEEKIDGKIYEQFLSGYGLAAKIIFDRQKPGLSKFDPDNIFAIMSGLLTNGKAIFNGRWMIAGKSPLTGTWGDSNCGGDFAPAIKSVGYDGIFFIGKSEKPVYLLIDGKKKELVDASGLWGKKDTTETEDYIKGKHGEDCKVACIGAGGENLSLISGVANAKGRLAGRSGLGALMGSKNLKAVALNGNKSVPVNDEDTVWQYTVKFLKELETDLSDFGKTMKNCGTAGTLTDSAESGDSPIKNWLGVGVKDFPPEMANKVNAFSVTKYETQKYHCYGCPFGCGGICHIPGEPLLKETHRPEYETISGFGAQLLNDDLHSIFLVNEMLNRAGIDTISCATTLDWAFEAYEKGILTKKKTGGLELTWGNHKAVIQVVKEIIKNEGFGAHLKDGVKEAEKYFREHLKIDPEKMKEVTAMHVQGQELPMHDTRRQLGDGGLGLGIGYEVEPTPGRHTSTFPGWDQYIKTSGTAREQFKKFKFQRKYEIEGDDEHKAQGENLKGSSCAEDIINGVGLCNFGFYFGPVLPLVEWINATTGWDKTFEDYLEIGQRIKTVRHAFNIREGIDVANIKMPERARGNPPLKEGPNAYSPNVLRWDDAKKDYYRAMGWDENTAMPKRETLNKLNLRDVEKALYGKKK